MKTYLETVYRYRILRHDELPEDHKAAYRAEGIDPNDNWSLIWSFRELAAAEKCLRDCIADAAKWETYKLFDAGQTETIERPIY